MDVPVPDDLPQGQAAKATATKPGSPTLTWVTLAMMTTASVASLRSAPTMAVYGLACVFLYLVPAIVFLLPTSLVSAELASGWWSSAAHPGDICADALLICDTGNAAVGRPTATTVLRGLANVVVTVATLHGDLHSGMFGGPAPDALAALIQMLATLRDAEGGTRIDGLDCTGTWTGAPYEEEQFRADASVLDGVRLTGSGSVADRLWARPAVTVLGIDCAPVVGSADAVPATARARVSLRVPPGTDSDAALAARTAHLTAAAPWGARVSVEKERTGSPFRAATDGPAYRAMGRAMEQAYGRPMEFLGQGGSIPCNVLAGTCPDAEIILMGVEEPRCLIHAPDESVDPSEIRTMSLVEALFLLGYASAR
ncbi:M20/M25/M40 family metallo-hydrolase [Streptomyces sp. NPDC058290]|uniref:M20/M25/M40 family metallo-hydrolase n=1 Tax=Streptomyces sp. NPDC058290 TaxID=3346426 RepID=UPI0036E76D86